MIGIIMEPKIIKRVAPQQDNTDLIDKCTEILAKTEWIASSDLSGVTRNQWAEYRSAITELMNNPPEGEVVFPNKPE
jgi:hypothetical protein